MIIEHAFSMFWLLKFETYIAQNYKTSDKTMLHLIIYVGIE